MLTSSGCAKSDSIQPVVGLTLPVLPANLKMSCRPARFKAGIDARAALARTHGAYKKCSHKQRDTVRFYTTVKTKFDRK